jgi:hypothetical protein
MAAAYGPAPPASACGSPSNSGSLAPLVRAACVAEIDAPIDIGLALVLGDVVDGFPGEELAKPDQRERKPVMHLARLGLGLAVVGQRARNQDLMGTTFAEVGDVLFGEVGVSNSAETTGVALAVRAGNLVGATVRESLCFERDIFQQTGPGKADADFKGKS